MKKNFSITQQKNILVGFPSQQAAFPPPLHFIAHYRTGSHGSASHRTTGEERNYNFALGNAYRQA